LDPDPAGLILFALSALLFAENILLRCRRRVAAATPTPSVEAATHHAMELVITVTAVVAALAVGGVLGDGVHPLRLGLALVAVALVRDPLPLRVSARLSESTCGRVTRLGDLCLVPLLAAIPLGRWLRREMPEPRPATAEEESDDTIRELLHNVYDFGDTRVREVMTPRPDIFTLPVELEPEQIVPELLRGHFSRVPVIDGDLDHVVGIVYAKDLLAAGHDPLPPLGELVQPPLFVPETRAIDELLRDFQRSHVHIAIVADEHGTTSGLVCMEDILRELVGELGEGGEERTIVPLGDGCFRVSAMTAPEAFNDAFATHIEGDDFESLGGYVIHRLDHFPSVGERVEVEGVEIVVTKVEGLRVVTVEVTAPSTRGVNA